VLTVAILLIVGAFVAAIVSAMGKCPLWVAVILLCVLALVEHLPLK
jgi:hypothetical protein